MILIIFIILDSGLAYFYVSSTKNSMFNARAARVSVTSSNPGYTAGKQGWSWNKFSSVNKGLSNNSNAMNQYAKGVVASGKTPQINGWTVSGNQLQYNGKTVSVGQLSQQIGGLMPGLYGKFGGKPFQQLPPEALAILNNNTSVPITPGE